MSSIHCLASASKAKAKPINLAKHNTKQRCNEIKSVIH